MEYTKHKDKQDDKKTRNLMISEAFLRLFVDILGDFWRFFSESEVKDGDLGKNGVVFDVRIVFLLFIRFRFQKM